MKNSQSLDYPETFFVTDKSKLTVIITGGLGVIGSLLSKKLSDLGIEFFIIDRSPLSERKRLEGLNEDWKKPKLPQDLIFFCDIADYAELAKAFTGILEKCTKGNTIVVVHLAGALETLHVDEIKETNIEGMRNLLNICKKYGITKIAAASSALPLFYYYSRPPYNLIWKNELDKIEKLPPVLIQKYDPNDEETIAELQTQFKTLFANDYEKTWAYVFSKIKGEQMGEEFVIETGGSFIAMRLGNVNGPNESHKYGNAAAAVWLSHNDAKEFIWSCIQYLLTHDKQYKVYFATSKSRYNWLTLEPGEKDLHWQPKDYAEEVIESSITLTQIQH